MKREPTVSVCMITYGHEQFIKQAIESVFMQQCDFEVELIIANDCSPDNTDNVVTQIIENHPNSNWIRYTRHTSNKGMMPNFVWAMKQANGKYIALCEGDDYWTDPLKLQKQVDFLDANPEYVISYHDAFVVNNESVIIKNSLLPINRKRDFTSLELKKGLLISTLTSVFKNKIDEFPDYLWDVPNGDTVLFSFLGKYGEGKYQEEIKNAAYRHHEGGVWSMIDGKGRANKRLFTNKKLLFHYKRDVVLAKWFNNKVLGNYKSLLYFALKERNFFSIFKYSLNYVKYFIKKLFKKI